MHLSHREVQFSPSPVPLRPRRLHALRVVAEVLFGSEGDAPVAAEIVSESGLPGPEHPGRLASAVRGASSRLPRESDRRGRGQIRGNDRGDDASQSPVSIGV